MDNLTIPDHRRLTRAEEVLAINLYRNARIPAVRERAANILLGATHRFGAQYAMKWLWTGREFRHLYNFACIGIWKAMDRFHPERGTRFLTCAFFWMRHAIQRNVFEGGSVDIPLNVRADISKLEKVERQLRSQGIEPTPEKIRVALGFKKIRFENAIHARRYAEVGFDTPLKDTYMDGSDFSLSCVLPDTSHEDPVEKIDRDKLWQTVQAAMKKLPERERRVLELRFGANDQTLDKVGKVFGLSREGARLVESKALAMIRKELFKAQ